MFMKGCGLRCPWCSNPENLEAYPQEYVKDGHIGIFGRYYSADELYHELIKDINFYDGKLRQADWNITDASEIADLPGGITFSGGECLLQFPDLIPLLKQLKEKPVHTTIETSLFVPKYNLDIALTYIDFFYIDFKILDSDRCKRVEHGNIQQFWENLDILFNWKDQQNRKKPIVVRIPVIGGYTDDNKNRAEIKELLTGLAKEGKAPLKIELIKEHNLGENKYRSLNMQPPASSSVCDDLMEDYRKEIEVLQIPVEICRI